MLCLRTVEQTSRTIEKINIAEHFYARLKDAPVLYVLDNANSELFLIINYLLFLYKKPNIICLIINGPWSTTGRILCIRMDHNVRR